MKNTIGNLFQVHTFGESHGVALGAVIDGMPSGVPFRGDVLIQDLMRRRPGKWDIQASLGTSSRQEPDTPELLSGVFEGLTLGTPIAVIIRNQNQRSEDYSNLPNRKGHADEAWRLKFGHVDPRGGGRSSGRETVSRVIGGAFAKMLISELYPALRVTGYASQIGPFHLDKIERQSALTANIDQFVARFPSSSKQEELKSQLLQIQKEGNSWGGHAEIIISNPPKGLGQPVFHKLKNELANAYVSLGAVCGIEIGESDLNLTGTEFHTDSQTYGGIQGGISTGAPIQARISFKPTASILDVAKKGRHDPCIVTRAIPVLEAMTNIVLADQILWQRLDRVNFECSI
jgi:chorismate synthase